MVGPGVFICNECVAKCLEILESNSPGHKLKMAESHASPHGRLTGSLESCKKCKTPNNWINGVDIRIANHAQFLVTVRAIVVLLGRLQRGYTSQNAELSYVLVLRMPTLTMGLLGESLPLRGRYHLLQLRRTFQAM